MGKGGKQLREIYSGQNPPYNPHFVQAKQTCENSFSPRHGVLRTGSQVANLLLEMAYLNIFK